MANAEQNRLQEAHGISSHMNMPVRARTAGAKMD